MKRSNLQRPEFLLAATFAGLILLGTLLLQLPAAQARGSVGLVDALFTSTSAVCVTGLTTVDTATRWTRFGQLVILGLIQAGGLGIMTFTALGAYLLRRRMSFSSQVAWQSSFFEGEARADFRRALWHIFILTAVIEACGALLLYVGLRNLDGGRSRGYEAVFHAVSAFCNAGFSTYSANAVALRGSPLVLCTLMGLIVLGGLGYGVLIEIVTRGWRRLWGRHRRGSVVWTLHARVVLRFSALLIVGGAVLLLLSGLTAGERTFGERMLHALFQSVTARTAGYNTVDIGALPLPSLLVLIGLMFIGGSPGSCAGGVKTTSAAAWLARVWTRLLGREQVTLHNRRLPQDVVRRAALVIAMATLWNLLGVFVLAFTEAARPGIRLEQLVFEQISAFGTVGLSANCTPGLTVAGKLWISATMFVGRVGPLTLALAVIAFPRSAYQYPAERVMIG